jgi:hypothetical protein
VANKISIEIIPYAGWRNCVRMTNGIVDLIATTDVGPRIIRFGFVGERNEFKEFPELLGKTGGRQWRVYGGHRLWHAPEHKTRTYFPDNFPIQYEYGGTRSVASNAPTRSRRSVTLHGTLRLIQPVERTTGIQKEILIRFSDGRASFPLADSVKKFKPSQAGRSRCRNLEKNTTVKITHRLRNLGRRAIELAPWALSVMDAGGTAILPLPPRGSHPKDLLPTGTLTLWAYTDLADPRWTLGAKYILLRQDSRKKLPQKLGAFAPDGWLAYANHGHLFVKKTQLIRGAKYPDLGCNVETFTNQDMLELETLGPLVELKAGHSVEHTEEWSLFRDVPTPRNDADVEKHILPKI